MQAETKENHQDLKGMFDGVSQNIDHKLFDFT